MTDKKTVVYNREREDELDKAYHGHIKKREQRIAEMGDLLRAYKDGGLEVEEEVWHHQHMEREWLEWFEHETNRGAYTPPFRSRSPK